MFSPDEIKLARQLLGLNQQQLAEKLGWSTKRNIVNLESKTSEKQCTMQTALAIECLLMRENKMDNFKQLPVITAAEFLGGVSKINENSATIDGYHFVITASTTDEQLNEFAVIIESDSTKFNGCETDYKLTGIHDHLTYLRDQLDS